MPGHPFSEEIFPNIQSKLLWMKLEVVSPCAIAGSWEALGQLVFQRMKSPC